MIAYSDDFENKYKKVVTMAEINRGYFLIGLSAFIWGLFPILTSSFGTSLNPLWNSALCTLISALPFAALIAFKRRWYELKNWTAVIYTIISATLIGIFYYLLIFSGSSQTSPQNTAVLLLLELLASALMLAPIKHERLSRRELLGCFLLFCSALLLSGASVRGFGRGDWLLVLAAFFPPFGNLYAKKARTLISAETLLLIRAVWSGLALLLIAIIFAGTSALTINLDNLSVLLITGVLLMGVSKVFWTEGLVLLKVTSALSLHYAVSPSVTFVAAFLFFNDVPSVYQLIALPVGILGASILLKGDT